MKKLSNVSEAVLCFMVYLGIPAPPPKQFWNVDSKPGTYNTISTQSVLQTISSSGLRSRHNQEPPTEVKTHSPSWPTVLSSCELVRQQLVSLSSHHIAGSHSNCDNNNKPPSTSHLIPQVPSFPITKWSYLLFLSIKCQIATKSAND